MNWVWSFINVMGLAWLFVCIIAFSIKKLWNISKYKDIIDLDSKTIKWHSKKIVEFDKRLGKLEKQEEDK